MTQYENGLATLKTFITERCIPAEEIYDEHINGFYGKERWTDAAVPPVVKTLCNEAKRLGLWNLFAPLGFRKDYNR